ncbi:MAG: CxxxxCH/CxxCH domain-containing protein [Deltaproteobacteria bacterium]
MNRKLLACALTMAAAALTSCGGQKAPEASSTGTGEKKGVFGVYYLVNVSRPVGGTINSGDGKIDCGTVVGVHDLCGPARYEWTKTATLSAIPDAGSAADPIFFQSWAGDCSSDVAERGCVLDTSTHGADKWVVAVFNPASRLGHGNILSPSSHARKFFKFLGNDADAPRCNTCHGAGYGGQATAPSCNACHAAAGWANWQQSCSFCHGEKSARTKAGYDFAAHPEWSAPPDDVNGRLTGLNGAAVGAHQKHVASLPGSIRQPIACSECHDPIPATAIHFLNHSLDLPFGPLSRSQGAVPLWNASTLTCSANYCHGNFKFGNVQGKGASLSWGGSLTGCTTCHDMPPAGHSDVGSSPAVCAGCHADTVLAGGGIDLVKGRHINGQSDVTGGACDSCHGFPPATGAHGAHWGLTPALGSSGYGDLGTLQSRSPGSILPTASGTAYAFGCGNCHPIAPGQHSMGSGSTVAKVLLNDGAGTTLPASSDAGPTVPRVASLKSRNSSAAAYDSTAKTCSGVYCHSSGREVNPAYVVTPAWALPRFRWKI